MKTNRRTTVISTAGKKISVHSNSSEYTASSEKENKRRGQSSRKTGIELVTLSTQFSDNGPVKFNKNLVSQTITDSEMETEMETGFSFDSLMTDEDQTLHTKVVNDYGKDIISNLKKKETSMIGNFDKHEIKSSHRKQMIVWVAEVLTIFKCPEDTFFMAVNIMDRYLEASKTSLVLGELHEIGIVSMFIASKYQEIEPLTLDLMVNKIAHGRITEKQILKREKEILCALKFKLGSPNALNFIDSYLEYFSSRIETEDKIQIKELAVQVAKNGISDRRIAFNMLSSELAICSIIIAIKNHAKSVKKTILTTEFSSLLKKELTSDEALVLQYGKRLRKLSVECIY